MPTRVKNQCSASARASVSADGLPPVASQSNSPQDLIPRSWRDTERRRSKLADPFFQNGLDLLLNPMPGNTRGAMARISYMSLTRLSVCLSVCLCLQIPQLGELRRGYSRDINCSFGLGTRPQEITVIRRRSGCRKLRASAASGHNSVCCVSTRLVE